MRWKGERKEEGGGGRRRGRYKVGSESRCMPSDVDGDERRQMR